MPDQLQIKFEFTAAEMAVMSFIRRGRDNAISMGDLSDAVAGCLERSFPTRELQDIIKHMIEEHGILICSSTGKNHGYYFPETQEDLDRGRNQLINRIRSTAARLKAVDKKAYEEIFGQGNLNV